MLPDSTSYTTCLRHVLERLVLALGREDVERLHERQTGVDHGRELPREDDDVARLDLAFATLLSLILFGASRTLTRISRFFRS